MTSETEEAVARVEAELALAGPHAMVSVHPIDDLRTILSALSASQAEVERLGRDVNQFVTCMCGQPMSADHYALGHAPVSVAEHYYNEQYARAQAAEARATRAEGLLDEAGALAARVATATPGVISDARDLLAKLKGDPMQRIADDYVYELGLDGKLKGEG